MEQRHRDILLKNRKYLIDNIFMVDFIHHVASLLNQQMEETIMSKATNTEKVACFLDILVRRGGNAFYAFLDALVEAECEFVKKHLEKQDQGRKQDCVGDYDETDSPGIFMQETQNGNLLFGKPSAMYRGYRFQCRRTGPSGNKYRTERAAAELKLAHHDAAIPPPQEKRKYQIVNQRLAQHKQECGMGKYLY
ncbi:hypothetical protein LSAT2_016621 [Lamellibrachia satsuma]|nr:hypothetical protein LSAT2_016621 [Lamellibrachia satsuma]